MTKTKKLKQLLKSKDLSFFMGAHHALSARIAEESGFDAIWAGGLGIAAQLGVRDSNEASWTQILETVEFMNDAVRLPILLDGDTGYGNFNNVRRLVRKLEQRGVAGVCIEDKMFPKTNSFINGERQPLAEAEEFCGRIRAAKDSQTDPDFCVVARVEALIAGWGLEEALSRAGRYSEAGADAILIHSKKTTAEEILAFSAAWTRDVPLIVVPTRYPDVPAEVFRKAGISAVIWANPLIRASIAAMQETATMIRADGCLKKADRQIASMHEVFRLQGAEELERAEKKYLGGADGGKKAVVLAASRGDGLPELTRERPKCMLPVRGKPIVERLVESFRKVQIRDIDVIAGYRADHVHVPGAEILVNSRYESTGELVSLECVLDRLAETTVISYGDILLRQYIIDGLMEHRAEWVIVVDSSRADVSLGRQEDRVQCSAKDTQGPLSDPVTLRRFYPVEPKLCHGVWTGLMKVSGEGRNWLRGAWECLKSRPDYAQLSMPHLVQAAVDAGRPVYVVYINGHWVNVNRLEDLEEARNLVSEAAP